MGIFDFMKKDEKKMDAQMNTQNFASDTSSLGNQQAKQWDASGLSQQQTGLPGQNTQDPAFQNNFSSPQQQSFSSSQQQNQFAQQSEFDLQTPFPHGNQDQIPPPIHQQEMPYPGNLPPPSDSKDMQLILSKLDAIRMAIQNLDHRLTLIEGKLEQPQQEVPSYHQQEQNIF